MWFFEMCLKLSKKVNIKIKFLNPKRNVSKKKEDIYVHQKIDSTKFRKAHQRQTFYALCVLHSNEFVIDEKREEVLNLV